MKVEAKMTARLWNKKYFQVPWMVPGEAGLPGLHVPGPVVEDQKHGGETVTTLPLLTGV